MSSLLNKAKPFELFVCYALEDEELYCILKKTAANLTRNNTINLRDLNSVEPGEESESKIQQHIKQADIALVLFSPDFIANDHCHEQLQKLIGKYQEDKMWLVAIILRPSDWKELLSNADDSKIRILPRDGEPVIKWRYQDEAFNDILKNIKEIIESLREEQYRQIEERHKLDIKFYQEELIDKPNDYVLWRNLASSFQELGKLQEASIHSDEATSSYKEALAALRQITENQPNSYIALSKQGSLLEKLDQPEAAADSYKKGLAIKPDDQILLSRSSAVQEKIGKYSVAITLYDKILEKDQSNYEIWTRRGEALRKSRRFKEAIESFNQSLVIQPNYRVAKYYQRKTYREITQST